MGPWQSAQVLGLRVDALTRDAVLNRIDQACARGHAMHVCTVSIHFVTQARRHPAFRAAVNHSGLCTADGRILGWVARLQGQPVPQQVTGHDVVRGSVALAARKGYRVFFLGGDPGVNAAAVKWAQRRYPHLRVAGCSGGKVDAQGRAVQIETEEALLHQLREFAPHILFVAMGAPKQELWIARMLNKIPPAVAVGVGSVFDTLAGQLPRAPKWMQRAGLESAFQLIRAPHRYARRYLLDDPRTLALAVGEALGKRMRTVFARH